MLPDVNYGLISLTIYTLLGIALASIPLLLLLTRVPYSYNLLNLVVRWKTTVMTGLAFTLVTGLLVLMLAFVNGMYALTNNSGQPGNVIVLAEGATDESFSNLAADILGDLENQPQVLVEGGQRLASRETFLIAVQVNPAPQPGSTKRRFLQMRGMADVQLAARVHGMTLSPGGEWFSEAGVRELPNSQQTALEVVLGYGLARELSGDRTPEQLAQAKNRSSLVAGDTFAVGERIWHVTGVLEPSNTTFDSEVWAKQSLIGPLFGKTNTTTLFLKTASLADATALTEFFNNTFEKSRVAAQTEAGYFEKLSQTNIQFLVAIGVLAAIMSLGGTFGVMNTMFAAISQRTRDIGVLRLMGYKRYQVLVSFLLESMLLALFGGLLGCAVGSLCNGWTANSIVSSGPGGGKFVVLSLTVDASVLAIGMGQALWCGLLGGLLPSFSAMRLTALDAMK